MFRARARVAAVGRFERFTYLVAVAEVPAFRLAAPRAAVPVFAVSVIAGFPVFDGPVPAPAETERRAPAGCSPQRDRHCRGSDAAGGEEAQNRDEREGVFRREGGDHREGGKCACSDTYCGLPLHAIIRRKWLLVTNFLQEKRLSLLSTALFMRERSSVSNNLADPLEAELQEYLRAARATGYSITPDDVHALRAGILVHIDTKQTYNGQVAVVCKRMDAFLRSRWHEVLARKQPPASAVA